jgi:methionine-gamma-lyase
MKRKLGFQTKSIHNPKGVEKNPSHVLPIYATSSFDFESIDSAIDIFQGKKEGYVYSRYGNPTIDSVAIKIANLETHGSDIEAKALMTSSGMSAIHTLLTSLLNPGDALLTQGNLYGGTTELLIKVFEPLNIDIHFVDFRQADEVELAINTHGNIKAIYFETPANPTLDCVDISWIVSLARSNDLISIIDNTFPTAYLQQPLLMGADYVLHSTTKYMNGHGTGIAGAIVGSSDRSEWKTIWTKMKLMGSNANPFDAWLVNNGLKTLALRMERHSSNAMHLANYLDDHKLVNNVNYPGLPSFRDHDIAKKQMREFGGMLSFEINGGIDGAVKFLNGLSICSLAPTLGDTETLLLHPATSSHLNVDKGMCEAYGITDGLIRVSVGLEDIDDIIADMEMAFTGRR